MPAQEHRLFIIHFPDCETCKLAKPQIHAWAEKHRVKLVELDITSVEWKARHWTPRVVPTLVLLEPNGNWHVREFEDPVESWVAGLDAWAKRVTRSRAEFW